MSRRPFAFFLLAGLLASPGAVRSAAPMPPACVETAQWLVPASDEVLANDALIGAMARRPIVLLGETHDIAEHHRWQLHVIAGLYGRNANMVLGFEAFPRSVQPVLDRWSRGEIDVKTFLAESRWNQVWRFDPELYLPLFQFARMHRVPMVALNADRALIARVRRLGWDAVPENERQGITDPAAPVDAYRKILAKSFAEHEKEKKGDPAAGSRDAGFGRFVDAQLTWDRAMAEKLAEARRRPGRPLVVGIIGSGHLNYGYGVPRQLTDLGVPDAAILLPWTAGRRCGDLAPKGAPPVADAVFGLSAKAVSVAGKKPLLGVRITAAAAGGVRVRDVLTGSIAEAAGISPGDVIVKAAGVALSEPGQLVAIVRRQAPGTWLPLRIERGGDTVDLVAKFPPRP